MNKVWEIKSLKRKPKGEEAQKILERIAKQVQPIMRKHTWRVKVLSEFCPKNPALLGVNVGAGINVKLRLRRPNRDEEFLPFNSVLDTMLHELCHNVHSPHNASFYKLWDELRKECEDLMSKGISGTGEGFDLPGKRLGGFFPQPSLSSLQKTAAAAAEKRARITSLMPPGPKRLGGNKSIMGALTPIQAAAMAAERRLQDDIWCGSESCNMHGDDCDDDDDSDLPFKPLNVDPTYVKPKLCSGVNPQPVNTIPRKRNRDPTNVSFSSSSYDHNALTSTSGSAPSHRDKSCKKVHAEGSSLPQPPYDHKGSDFVDLTDDNSNQRLVPNHDVVHSLENSWQCSMCTLLNPIFAPICELCQARKPKDSDDNDNTWSCKFCTLENNIKLEKCAACGEWRYSHGPPVATPAPNLGT